MPKDRINEFVFKVKHHADEDKTKYIIRKPDPKIDFKEEYDDDPEDWFVCEKWTKRLLHNLNPKVGERVIITVAIKPKRKK